jgi:hypothetical protein
MIAAKSSYLAWDSRGSWPKRLKANGAAVEVGNREKEEEEDIFAAVVLGLVWGVGVGKKMLPCKGHHPHGAYICAP